MNIFQKLVKSIYSPEAIAGFRQTHPGKAVLYIFLLMLIATLPVIITTIFLINSLIDSGGDYLDEMPDFTIEDGTLESGLDEPMREEIDGMTIVVDDTGETSVGDLDGKGDVIALLERNAVFSVGGIADQLGYQEFGLDVSKEEIESFYLTIDGLSGLLAAGAALLIYLFNTGSKFIGVLFLSLIALLMKRSRAPHLRYRDCFVLSAFTVTMPTLLFAALEAFGIIFPFQFAFYWIIAVVMLNLVMKHVPSADNSDESQPSEPSTST
ncbi:DUF1189 domain-containing protein [Alkalicoccus chagannorensis]|uniref:DUF1189 domain-containing protein n=1 Tax=Alkalicoccus chagannorensis TaxID=427072 RepID=UPI0004255191|nr:DUF1189 domain-containing protein [Alkalicoccus chagannorensis]